jgi:exodeoxyribonuclease VII small subunit
MAESSRPPRPAAKPAAPASPRASAGGSGEQAGARAADAESELQFEEALERLESIVDRLEGGDLVLEHALASFEEGVHLSRRLAAQLASAEQRVERLLREGGELLTRPFDQPETEPESGDS